jgi:hypothetical protein
VNPFGEVVNVLANASHFVANPHTSLLMPHMFWYWVLILVVVC